MTETPTKNKNIKIESYHSPEDNVMVVHVDTPGLAENEKGPLIRLYLNDEAVFENPPFPYNESSKQVVFENPPFPYNESSKQVVFDMKLFDDASVREKLKMMSKLEVMFDDERNAEPDEYYQLMADLPLNTVIRISIKIIPAEETNGQEEA